MVIAAARSGMGMALANTVIAHDDFASGRLVRLIAHAMEAHIGCRMLIPKAVKQRSEMKDFRAWLLHQLAASFCQSAEEESDLHTAPTPMRESYGVNEAECVL